jgi:hypothetical protein
VPQLTLVIDKMQLVRKGSRSCLLAKTSGAAPRVVAGNATADSDAHQDQLTFGHAFLVSPPRLHQGWADLASTSSATVIWL